TALAQHVARHVDLLDVRVGDADLADQALLLQDGERLDPRGVADAAVRAVPVIEVHRVGVERRQRGLEGGAEVGGGAVAATALGRACDAALGGDRHLRAVPVPAAQRLGDDLLVVPHGVPAGGVDVGGVEQGDAGVESGVDGGHGALVRGGFAAPHR